MPALVTFYLFFTYPLLFLLGSMGGAFFFSISNHVVFLHNVRSFNKTSNHAFNFPFDRLPSS